MRAMETRLSRVPVNALFRIPVQPLTPLLALFAPPVAQDESKRLLPYTIYLSISIIGFPELGVPRRINLKVSKGTAL